MSEGKGDWVPVYRGENRDWTRVRGSLVSWGGVGFQSTIPFMTSERDSLPTPASMLAR